MKGFLGTGATFGADLNLVVQLIMGVKEKPRGQPELRQNCVGIVPVNNSYW